MRHFILIFFIIVGPINAIPFWKKIVHQKSPYKQQKEQNIVQTKTEFGENKPVQKPNKTENNCREKRPLPKVLTFEKTYDFFDNIPERLRPFVEQSLNFPNFPDKAEIFTSTRKIDPRGHVTTGRLNIMPIILKRKKESEEEQSDRKNFYAFMDVVKKKLKELAAMGSDHAFSAEDKKCCLQYGHFIGLGNIVPIIGIAKVHRLKKGDDETVEILPKIPGNTLLNCIEQNLPPYDTPSGFPRNQAIALDLLLQMASTCLVLNTCQYIHNDLWLRNVIVYPTEFSFALRLIDWGDLKKVKRHSEVTEEIHGLGRMFLCVLLGQCYFRDSSGPFEKFLGDAPNEDNETKAKTFQKKCLHCLHQKGIYTPRSVKRLTKLISDMLFPGDHNKLDAEAIVLQLEALLIDGDKETKVNDTSLGNSGIILEENS